MFLRSDLKCYQDMYKLTWHHEVVFGIQCCRLIKLSIHSFILLLCVLSDINVLQLFSFNIKLCGYIKFFINLFRGNVPFDANQLTSFYMEGALS